MRRISLTLLTLLASIALAIADGGPDAALGGGLKIYTDQLDPAPFSRVTYGYDRDAVCPRGQCQGSGAACLNNAICGADGPCVFDSCASDFKRCTDGVTVCNSDGDCPAGQSCDTDFPCAPPEELCGVKVDSLTPGAPADQTIWKLVCDPDVSDVCQAGSWDFSGFNTTTYADLSRTATTIVEISSAETDNHDDCGFNYPGVSHGRVLSREDKGYDTAQTISTINAIERVGGGATSSILFKGVVRYDDIPGPLAHGESRLCHADDDGENRSDLALWHFPQSDASGNYMELGSLWETSYADCEYIILSPSVGSKVRSTGGFPGPQSGLVVNEGVVDLPSGHSFESLVVRSVTEFTAYDGAFCLFAPTDVRTVIYLWEVPHLGTVVRLQSDKIAGAGLPNPAEDFTHLAELDIKYGLFPPLSVTVDGVSDTTVDLSWDPGQITEHIDGYRIYWDTESGGQCSTGLEDCTADHPGAGFCGAGETCCGTPGDVCDSYDSDSVNHPGQVSFNSATSATISGLAPNTRYFFTITAMSDFTDPASSVTTSYESVLYPTQLPAVPAPLPLEVNATTSGSCSPSLEIDGVTAGKSGSDVELCWNASADPCIEGYRILGATSPEFAGGFSPLVDAGLTTCHTFDPVENYFIVIGRGSGGTGPWGHFGQ
jgi:hypothetical protein